MAKLYKEIFSDIIRKQINEGKFKTKQELITFLHDFNTHYFDNPELMQELKQAGINLKELDVNAVTQELLNYYDKGKTDDPSLNLDGVTSVVIDGKDYIKAEVDGTTVLLDDSVNKDNLAEQIKHIQNASYDYRNSDGVKNKDQIIEAMRRDKTEVNLVSSNKINTRELSEEERKEFAAVMNVADANAINFLVDPDRNIYINKDTGETFYARKNSEGQMEVRIAEQTTPNSIEQEPNYVSGLGDIVTEKESEINNLEDLSNPELQHLIDDDLLTSEQKTTVLDLLKKRNEQVISTPDEETINNVEQNSIPEPNETVTEVEPNNLEDLSNSEPQHIEEELLTTESKANENEQNSISEPNETVTEVEPNNLEDLSNSEPQHTEEEVLTIESKANDNEQNSISESSETVTKVELNNLEDLSNSEPQHKGGEDLLTTEQKTNDNESRSNHISDFNSAATMDESRFKNLSDSDLQYIVDTNKISSLSATDQATILNLLERRNERTIGTSYDEETNINEQKIEQGQPSIEHQKVKTLQLLNKPYNGFTSVLYLALTTLSIGICFILYLMVKIYL